MSEPITCDACFEPIPWANRIVKQNEETEAELESARLMLWALANGWEFSYYPKPEPYWFWLHRKYPSKSRNGDLTKFSVPATSDLPELSDELREAIRRQREIAR